MTTTHFRSALPLLLVAGALSGPSHIAVAQSLTVPLTADRWTASDTIRFETHLGRLSVYISKGVALARDIDVRDGTIEYDMAATKTTNFVGAAFHARSLDFSEVVFFRIGSSRTPEAVQYGPALNDYGAAWQIYHGDGANAVAVLPREQWIHVKLVLAGQTASVFLNDDSKPTLVVPRLAGTDGGRLGVWGGNFGRGSYYSNIRYTIDHRAAAAPAPLEMPRGTIAEWELSDVLDATTQTPGHLPDLSTLKWERVRAEQQGFVLINRFRHAPAAALPVAPGTGIVQGDSIMNGRVAGTKVVFARATIDSDRDRMARMRFGYSDGVVIYENGDPLYFGMNPIGLRGMGVIETNGEAVFLRLKKGRNDIVFAVTEYSGGWGFWAQLDR